MEAKKIHKRKFYRCLSAFLLVMLLIIQSLLPVCSANAATTTKRLGSLTSVGISKDISTSTLKLTANPTTSYSGGTWAYQWYQSTNCGASWNVIPGATNKTYSVSMANKSSNYCYKYYASYSFATDESYQLVDNAYLAFLGRHAETGGNEHWWGQLVNHTISVNAKNSITNAFALEPSNEIAALAINVGMSVENYQQGVDANSFVTECYQFLLGREPDPSGFSNWVSVYNEHKDETVYFEGRNTTLNAGMIHVINRMANSSEAQQYFANNYAYNASTGQFTYTATTSEYLPTVTCYVDGTSSAVSIPTYEISCVDKVGDTNGTVLGTQTVINYTKGTSVSGSVWGNSSGESVYYRGYCYSGCSTITVNGTGTVERYFTKVADNVIYDFATNGGTSCDSNSSYYLNDDAINLSPVAYKEGYEFIGWNTDKDARVGLQSLTKGPENVTLYAIYRKQINYTYHFYETGKQYTQVAYMFNNENDVFADTDGSEYVYYIDHNSVCVDSPYSFVGYSLDANKEDNQGVILNRRINIPEDINIYSVYQLTGKLSCYAVDGSLLCDVSSVRYGTSTTIPTGMYSYTLPDYQPSERHHFEGWDSNGTLYQSGDELKSVNFTDSVQAKESPIMAELITLTPSVLKLRPHERVLVSPIISPDDTLVKDVVWTSTDSSIVSVDAYGYIVAHQYGQAILTAETNNGLVANITVIVQARITYDYQTNGGESCSLTEPHLDVDLGEAADLSYEAVKEGYEFVGWNTDKDAHIGLSDMIVSEDATLYAIFRQENLLTYHTYNASQNYTQTYYVFNAEQQPYTNIEGTEILSYMSYPLLQDSYRFVYYAQEDGTQITESIISSPISDVYCAYQMKGCIIYLDENEEVIATRTNTNIHLAEDVLSNEFSYTLLEYDNKNFIGWNYGGELWDPNDILVTQSNNVTVYAVFQEDRVVTVQGRLLDTNNHPIANATITLSSNHLLASVGNTPITGYRTTTDTDGYYKIENVNTGSYICSVTDANNDVLAICDVIISAPSEQADEIAVTNKNQNVNVHSTIENDIFIINVEVKASIVPLFTPLTGDAIKLVYISLIGIFTLVVALVLVIQHHTNRKA